MASVYRSQIKKFERGKQTAPVDVAKFSGARDSRNKKTSHGRSKAIEKVAQKHGYKSGKHMDRARSKPSYMPGPGSPKY